MSKVFKLWCEWDLGIHELYSSKEALIAALESLNLATLDIEGFQNYTDMMQEGVLGFEEEIVID